MPTLIWTPQINYNFLKQTCCMVSMNQYNSWWQLKLYRTQGFHAMCRNAMYILKGSTYGGTLV